jgi:hypothetical protein
MKKLLLATLLGLGLALLPGQRAAAWHKCNFNAGVNFSSEGGGNSVAWGLFKGSQMPQGMYEQLHGMPGGPGMLPPESVGVPMGQEPQRLQMPRADAQPVGYFAQGQAEESNYQVPSYWYGR